jgi:hypothetical protein
MLAKLKEDSEFLDREGAGRKKNALEEIAEDPEDYEDASKVIRPQNLTVIREDNDDDLEASPQKGMLGNVLEPDQNISQYYNQMHHSNDKM